jgi:Ser/Thr protein kinase RdoA (MazF antagonist)
MIAPPRATFVSRLPRPSRISNFVVSRMSATTIERTTLDAVLDRYGLRRTRGPRNLQLGRRSRNVVVATDAGDVVVKRYRDRWAPGTVRQCHSIVLRLGEVGFPAVRLLIARDGESWVREADGLFAIFGFVAGTNYSLTYLRRADRLRLAQVAGETLGRMHLALEGFAPDGDHHLGLTASGTPVRDGAWHAATVEELAARSRSLAEPTARRLAQAMIDLAPAVLAELGLLEAEIADARLPSAVIHGDFGLHNLLFAPDGTAVPVDFEVARLDHRVNDLISAAGKFRTGDAEYDEEAIETFYRGYAVAWPLSEAELDRFADAWRRYRLRAAVQYWNSYFETDGPVRKLRSAIAAIEQASWPERHPDALERLRRAAAGEAR